MPKKPKNPKKITWPTLSKKSKKTAWSTMQGMDHTMLPASRDVYESQQLTRGKIKEKGSKAPYYFGSGLAFVVMTIVSWLIISGFRWLRYQLKYYTHPESPIQPTPPTGFRLHDIVPYIAVGKDESGGRIYREIIDSTTGALTPEVYTSAKDVPQPQWYLDLLSSGAWAPLVKYDLGHFIYTWSFFGFLFSCLCGIAVFAVVHQKLMKVYESQNVESDVEDINQYEDDQHVALPEEIMDKFDFFPDAGAHAPVEVSSMISHVMLDNKGVKPVYMAQRHTDDILDKDGDVETYKGEHVFTDDGDYVYDKYPMFDKEFGEDLFTASGAKKEYWKWYSPAKIPYNPGNKDRAKQKDCDTVADLINEKWVLPVFETQRPAGAYIVDTAPVNTMVLAITRAGKGQTIIEPTIDMWTRELKPSNMVINDPKGELLKKFYVPATYRGFQIVQFNLINVMNTDIYNPLGIAAEAAREKDFKTCAECIEGIASVFFPVEGADDPVWPNAANNAFKRVAFGLIDYYMEEEIALRAEAAEIDMDPKMLETKLDQMWAKVTLYNCYQFFVQLISKKQKNPQAEIKKYQGTPGPDGQIVYPDGMSEEECHAKCEELAEQAKLWNGSPEIDQLSLYFNATNMLPKNQIRQLTANAHNSLMAIAGADKMLSSVYGIATTEMNFFTDPTISTLTSGAPSQNIDMEGVSFPRRLGFRLSRDYIDRYRLRGMTCRWSAYEDADFKVPLGSKFAHDDQVSDAGWVRFYIEGIFPHEDTYLKCIILNPSTGQYLVTFYFKFTKGYQTSLDGRSYMKDPILDEKIVRDGYLTELRPLTTESGEIYDYEEDKVTFEVQRLCDLMSDNLVLRYVATPAIEATMVHYNEKPKAIFLVTPPHLQSYAKLLLIFIKQVVDRNFATSYVTRPDQKPLLRTRFMLDELGNLQSSGNGIQNFATMLSIGLGQEQQFTLILQTMQQLIDVYGGDVDRVLMGNTSNIVFLKSTDSDMIETLSKMSGTTHVVRKNSKTISRNTSKIIQGVESGVSSTFTAESKAVITYNDLQFIPMCNSMVFRAGDSPVWNRNQMCLPMAWRLHQNTIKEPGRDFTFRTVPTLSTARDFDVRQNQPDVQEMLAKRLSQAKYVQRAREIFIKGYGFSELDITRLDPDWMADEIMTIVSGLIAINHSDGAVDPEVKKGVEAAEENTEVIEEQERVQRQLEDHKMRRYAEGLLSRESLVSLHGAACHSLDEAISNVYRRLKNWFANDKSGLFCSIGDSGPGLYSSDGVAYIVSSMTQADRQRLNDKIRDPKSRIFSADDMSAPDQSTPDHTDDDVAQRGFRVTDEFYKFLASLDTWIDLLDGRFDREMAREMSRDTVA